MAEYQNNTKDTLRFKLARHEYVVPAGKKVTIPDHLVYAVSSMQIRLTRTDVTAEKAEKAPAEPEPKETVVKPVEPKVKPKPKSAPGPKTVEGD